MSSEIEITKDRMAEHEAEVERIVNQRLAGMVKASAKLIFPPLPTKPEIKTKITGILNAWARARSIALHRDDEAALVESLAEAFYVAPPVEPGEVEGVG